MYMEPMLNHSKKWYAMLTQYHHTILRVMSISQDGQEKQRSDVETVLRPAEVVEMEFDTFNDCYVCRPRA